MKNEHLDLPFYDFVYDKIVTTTSNWQMINSLNFHGEFILKSE